MRVCVRENKSSDKVKKREIPKQKPRTNRKILIYFIIFGSRLFVHVVYLAMACHETKEMSEEKYEQKRTASFMYGLFHFNAT